MSQERGRWQSLDCLAGTVNSLYALAVRSKVKYLARDSSLGSVDHRKLLMILSGAHPSSLDLTLRVPEFDLSRVGEFLEPARESLATLHLTIKLHWKKYKDPTSKLVSLNSILRSEEFTRNLRSETYATRPYIAFNPNTAYERSMAQRPGENVDCLERGRERK